LTATIVVGSPDSLTYQDFAGDDKIYVDGEEHTQLSSNAVSFSDIVAAAEDAHAIFDVYAVKGTNGIATLEKRERARYTTAATPPALAGVVQLRDISRDTPTAGTKRIFFDDTADTLAYDSGTGTFGPARDVPTSSDITIRLYDQNEEFYLDVYVDILTNWGGLDGGGDITENITLQSLPSVSELEARLLLTTILFSGSATGDLGNDFSIPRIVRDQRYFGMLGYDDLRDDTRVWQEARIDLSDSNLYSNLDADALAAITDKILGIGVKRVNGVAKVEIKGDSQNQGGILVRSGLNGTGVSILDVDTNGLGIKISGTGPVANLSSNTSSPAMTLVNAGTGKGIEINARTGIDITSTSGTATGITVTTNSSANSAIVVLTTGTGMTVSNTGTGLGNTGIDVATTHGYGIICSGNPFGGAGRKAPFFLGTQSSDPGSLDDGAMWIRANTLYIRLNGVTRSVNVT
jgi:hypothetical protein